MGKGESKIAGRRKRRAEKREGRKEGRTRASRRSGRRTHRSQAGQARNLSLSPSFSFDPRPRSLRASRASQSLSLSLAPARTARAALSSSLSTGRRQSPPLHSSRHREPPPSLPRPRPSPCPPPHARHPHPSPPQAALLAVTTRSPRQTKTNYAAFSEPQRAPTSYTTVLPLGATAVLDPRLPPSTELASYVAQPSSRHFPRPCPDHPRPIPPASETLRYVGHQMGAQPLRTLREKRERERLLRE